MFLPFIDLSRNIIFKNLYCLSILQGFNKFSILLIFPPFISFYLSEEDSSDRIMKNISNPQHTCPRRKPPAHAYSLHTLPCTMETHSHINIQT